MKQALLATAIAAYLLKYPKLKEEAKSQEELNRLVGDQLANIVQYFNAHASRNTFFSTPDKQVFYDELSAKNHTGGREIVLRIDREDVKELLDAPAGEAESKAQAANNDYSKLSLEDLKALCTERAIAFTEDAKASELIKLLLDSTGTGPTVTPAPEKVDYNALTVPKLKEECEARKIDTAAFKKKDEYVAALVADDAAKANQ